MPLFLSFVRFVFGALYRPRRHKFEHILIFSDWTRCAIWGTFHAPLKTSGFGMYYRRITTAIGPSGAGSQLRANTLRLQWCKLGRDYLFLFSAGNPFKSCRIMGREGCRRATVLNPSRRNAEAVPVNMLDVQPGRVTSTGYASTASALARLPIFKASAMRADIMPCLR